MTKSIRILEEEAKNSAQARVDLDNRRGMSYYCEIPCDSIEILD